MMLVIGHGVTGRAVAQWAQARGEEVVVVDDSPDRATGVLATDEALDLVADAEVVVPSPGVPLSHPVLTEAQHREVPIVAEIDLAMDELDDRGAKVRLVAVTGTNGKTTVTTLVADMLVASGIDAATAGNIGHPLVEVARGSHEVIVAEVSSFQLASAQRFHPDVAVILNVADDHLDWHGGADAYAAAKARIMACQDADDTVVFNAADPVVVAMVADAEPSVIAFGAASDDRADAVLAGAKIPPHLDRANAIAAATAARAVGATDEGIVAAVENFARLPHRVVPVGEAGGVYWVDDSKATNPHAANHAIAAFGSVVLLAGGRNKGLDLAALRTHEDRLRAVVAFGEAADDVVHAFSDSSVPCERVADIPAAVATADRLAMEGDTVLLSPGCTSLDAYRNYAARGDHFAAEVRALVSRRGAGA